MTTNKGPQSLQPKTTKWQMQEQCSAIKDPGNSRIQADVFVEDIQKEKTEQIKLRSQTNTIAPGRV